MDPRPVLVVYSGGVAGSAEEDLVGAARAAAGLDAIERALGSGAFAGAVFVTDRMPAPADVPPGVDVASSPEPFHFGRALAGLVTARGWERVVYFGAGAAPLMTAEDFADVAARLAGGPVVVTNNFYSADLVGFTPGAAMTRLPPPETDNPLARLLHEYADLPTDALPRTTANQLDIDTPTSLTILALHGGTGPRLERLLRTADLPVEPYRRAAHVFVERERMALVAGRVGSHVWQYLERQTACRVRLFAEERGMQADGREAAGLARSLLGMYLDAVGLDRFFAAVAELGDAAFIDTRVLTAHAHRFPDRRDRFLSDLLRPEQIADPFLRDLTAGALRAPVPVVVGGHALVSGGLMALVQAAWDARDRELADAARQSGAIAGLGTADARRDRTPR